MVQAYYVEWYLVFPLAKKKEILKNFSAPNNCANITAVWEKNLNKMEILSHSTSARGKKNVHEKCEGMGLNSVNF